MSASFERFCLAAGLETLSEMLEQDATAACGERHERGERRQAHRWGRTKGKIGFHGGKVAIERPRVRGLDGAERVLPSWENAVSEDLLGKWAMNQMLINVSTRRFKRSVRLPEGDVPASDGAGLSKSATSRRFVALSAARMRAWMETRLDDLDLLAIQIDGIHMDEDMLLVAAIGVDANGDKHPLGLVEGATENATTVQALIDNLIERGLDPTVRRLFIIDGAKALSKAIRRTFGRDAAIQRCQFTRRATFWSGCPNRCTLRCGASAASLEMDDAERAETLIRNLARRLEPDWNGVSASILEGINEMLTVTRLGLPCELRRSLACTNIIENVMGTVRRVPQRQILALALDGPAMGRRRHARSVQGLPSIEGKKASASPSRCSCKARSTAAFRRSACSNRRGCVNFNAQRPLREFQQTPGHPPCQARSSLSKGHRAWPEARGISGTRAGQCRTVCAPAWNDHGSAAARSRRRAMQLHRAPRPARTRLLRLSSRNIPAT